MQLHDPALSRLIAGSRRWAEAIGWLVGALVLVALITVTRVAGPLDAVVHDAIVRATPQPPDPRILIVGIDEASVRALGRWPWPRATHAAMIDRLSAAGVAAIGYDVLFVDPAEGDGALQAALDRARRVALPLLIAAPADGGGEPVTQPPVVRPATTGHVVVRADRDGMFRRVTLAEPVAGGAVAHMAVATLRLTGTAPKRGGTLIPFAGPAGHYPTVSFVAVLRGEVPRELIAGRIVLVGATASGLGDRFATTVGSERDLLAGVEVQANVIQALGGSGLRRDGGRAAALALALIALAGLGFGFVRLSPRANMFAVAAVLGLVVAVSALLLVGAGLWVPPATALIAVVVMFPAWGWRRLAIASRYLETQLDGLGPGATLTAARGDDTLTRQIAKLDAATARMHRLRAQRDETLAFLSHDLRQPAVAIVDLSPADPRIAAHAHRMLRLADQFVQGVRAEEAPLVIELVELAALLDEAVDQCWEAAQRVGGRIAVDCAWELPDLAIDRALMARAVVNLIDNALRYGGEVPTVHVRGWCDRGDVVVTVADRGAGLTDARVATLFDRFDRSGATSTDGAGLGLAIVATFARRHGGRVTCVSRQGIGTLFALRLPLGR